MYDLSLIITVYNNIHHVERISSYVRALHRRIQVIIIDDCSKDGSYEYLLDLQMLVGRITVVRNIKNMGVSAARNRGIELAESPLITFVDADDMIDPSALLRCVRLINDDPNHDLYITEYATSYCVQGNTLTDRLECEDKVLAIEPLMHDLAPFRSSHTSRRLIYHICLSAWGKIYRTGLLRSQNIRFPEGLSKFEDCVFGLCYTGSVLSVRLVSECFYTYSQERDPGSGLSNSFSFEQWLNFINQFPAFIRSPLFEYPVTVQFRSICLLGTIVRFLSSCSFKDVFTLRGRLAKYPDLDLESLRNIHVCPKGADLMISFLFKYNLEEAIYLYLRIKNAVFAYVQKPPFWCLSQSLE